MVPSNIGYSLRECGHHFRRNWTTVLGAVVTIFLSLFIIGLFSMLYGFVPFNLEVNQAFIAAILTIIGYAINDTVVVFDRIREYLGLYPKRNLKETVNNAINSTLSRTINTSGTTLVTPGTRSLRMRSTPWASVICDIGQPLQAPCSSTLTTPSSVTSTSWTSPPSACRLGRISSSTAATSFLSTMSVSFSSVSISGCDSTIPRLVEMRRQGGWGIVTCSSSPR